MVQPNKLVCRSDISHVFPCSGKTIVTREELFNLMALAMANLDKFPESSPSEVIGKKQQ